MNRICIEEKKREAWIRHPKKTNFSNFVLINVSEQVSWGTKINTYDASENISASCVLEKYILQK